MSVEATVSSSATHFRLLIKRPEYFQRAESSGVARRSAVERLEADKAKYVKSQHVARTRQEPVRPPATPARPLAVPAHKPLLPLANGRAAPLSLGSLSSLINDTGNMPCPPPNRSRLNPVTTSNSAGSSSPSSSSTLSPQSTLLQPRRPPLPPPSMAVRRVDVRPQVAERRLPPRVQQWRPLIPQPGTMPVHSPPPPSPASTSSLQRSKSDLSDRFSRANADLERFFNYCGLDPSDMEGLTAAGSDITSLSRLRSASAPGSEYGGSPTPSQQGKNGEDSPTGRVPYGVSVIERNARVIKWLYGLQQDCGARGSRR